MASTRSLEDNFSALWSLASLRSFLSLMTLLLAVKLVDGAGAGRQSPAILHGRELAAQAAARTNGRYSVLPVLYCQCVSQLCMYEYVRIDVRFSNVCFRPAACNLRYLEELVDVAVAVVVVGRGGSGFLT